MKKIQILALTALLPTLAFAQVYKITNPDGSVSYTDQPQGKSKEVTPKPIQTYSAPPSIKATPSSSSTETSSDDETKKETAATYTNVAITAPKNGAAIRANDGNVNVLIDVQPGLNASLGDTITLLLNGKAVGKPGSKTGFQLNNLNRGSHTLKAILKSANGETLFSSPSVTFTIHRAHINSPAFRK